MRVLLVPYNIFFGIWLHSVSLRAKRSNLNLYDMEPFIFLRGLGLAFASVPALPLFLLSQESIGVQTGKQGAVEISKFQKW